jgi:hypothetical protein
MRSLLLKAALFGGAFATPISISQVVTDGFPTPNQEQTQQIEANSLGTLPNGPAPPAGAIPADGITNLQLINLNENSEVAFFGQLIQNVTNNVAGYQITNPLERNFVLQTLKAVLAVSCPSLNKLVLTMYSKRSFTLSTPLARSSPKARIRYSRVSMIFQSLPSKTPFRWPPPLRMLCSVPSRMSLVTFPKQV